MGTKSLTATKIAIDQAMKNQPRKNLLTFGDFVMRAYDVGGKRKANGIVWLAVNSNVVKFHGPKRFVVS